MADMTPEQIDRLLKELHTTSSSVTSAARNMERFLVGSKGGSSSDDGDVGRAKASRKLTADLHGTAEQTVKSMKLLGGSTEDLARSLRHALEGILGGFIGGELVGGMIDAGMNMIKTYRKLSDVGQTFGGSISSMSTAAAASGMHLDDFADMMIKNSTVASVLASNSNDTSKGLGSLYKAVKTNLNQYGLMGMSLAEVGDITGEYADTLRLTNMQTLKNNDASKAAITKFAMDVSDYSNLAGKSKEQIAKDANAALQDASYMSANLSKAQRAAAQDAAPMFAALPGELGTQLSTAITQSVGRNGIFALSNMGKELISAGAMNVADVGQQITNIVESGRILTDKEKVRFGKALQDAIGADMPTLSLQNMNGQYESIIKTLSSIQGVNMDNYLDAMRALKRQKGITASLLDLDSVFADISSAFRESFLNGLHLDEYVSSTGKFSKNVQELASTVGKATGDLVHEIFSEKNMKAMGKAITDFTAYLTSDKFKKDVKTVEDAFSEIGTFLMRAAPFFKSFADGMFSISNSIDHFNKVLLHTFGIGNTKKDGKQNDDKDKNEAVTSVGKGILTIFEGLMAVWVGKKLLGGIMGFFSRSFRKANFEVGIANINVGGTGGSMLNAAEHALQGGGPSGKKKLWDGIKDTVAGAKNENGIREGVWSSVKRLWKDEKGSVSLAKLAKSKPSSAEKIGEVAAKAAAKAAAKTTSAVKIGEVAKEAAKTTSTLKAGLATAKTVASGLHGAASFGAKLLPGLGVVASVADGAYRYKHGDKVGAVVDGATAGLDGFAAGADATGIGIPLGVIASGLSAVLQGGLFAKDYFFGEPDDDKTPDPAVPVNPTPPTAAPNQDDIGVPVSDNKSTKQSVHEKQLADNNVLMSQILKTHQETLDTMKALLAVNQQAAAKTIALQERGVRAAEQTAQNIG